jgi:hypothetical protein
VHSFINLDFRIDDPIQYRNPQQPLSNVLCTIGEILSVTVTGHNQLILLFLTIPLIETNSVDCHRWRIVTKISETISAASLACPAEWIQERVAVS